MHVMHAAVEELPIIRELISLVKFRYVLLGCLNGMKFVREWRWDVLFWVPTNPLSIFRCFYICHAQLGNALLVSFIPSYLR